MTRKVMDNLYKELESNGVSTFIEQEWRFLSKGCGGKEDYICFGVLRNSDGVPFTPMHLYKILNIARQKKAYMVQIIGEKDIKNPRLAAAANATPMKKNDIRVCFIQMGLIRAIEKARVPVMESLGRSFAYCQEDESVLALEKNLGTTAGGTGSVRVAGAGCGFLGTEFYPLPLVFKKGRGNLLSYE